VSDNRIAPLKAAVIFMTATVYFYFLLFTIFPFLKSNFDVNPILYWLIIGYCLFIPLFVYALMMARWEGRKGIRQLALGLNIKPFSKKDWVYSILGLLVTFVCTGLIYGVSILMNKYLGTGMLKTTPWFMEVKPLQGTAALLLLIWFPMFFFNIVGEEALWRGYIQSRFQGRYSWLLCAVLWLMFHLPFGFGLMVMLIPVVIIVPYVFHKTHNTLVGILIHGIYNGPTFVAVALGMIK
jgi:membrane protease YdiL (CAAX protease family)